MPRREKDWTFQQRGDKSGIWIRMSGKITRITLKGEKWISQAHCNNKNVRQEWQETQETIKSEDESEVSTDKQKHRENKINWRALTDSQKHLTSREMQAKYVLVRRHTPQSEVFQFISMEQSKSEEGIQTQLTRTISKAAEEGNIK